jgi:hypothetical protein
MLGKTESKKTDNSLPHSSTATISASRERWRRQTEKTNNLIRKSINNNLRLCLDNYNLSFFKQTCQRYSGEHL